MIEDPISVFALLVLLATVLGGLWITAHPSGAQKPR